MSRVENSPKRVQTPVVIPGTEDYLEDIKSKAMSKIEEELVALKIEKVKLEIEDLKKPETKDAVWNSLEAWKFAVSLLLPVVILTATCSLKRGEETRANDSRIAALRFEKFQQLSGHLNNIYCYFTYVGQWKELTPIDVIYEKRAADKIQNMNLFLFSDKFNERYKRFICACFLEGGGGWGKDALLRTDYENRKLVEPTTRRRDADTVYTSFKWQEKWDSLFITKYEMYKDSARTSYSTTLNDYRGDIRTKYNELIEIIGDELNVKPSKK